MSTFHNHYNQHSQHPRPWLYPQTVLGIADCTWNWLWGPSWNLRAWCTGCPWQVGWTYSRSNDSSALKSRNFNRLFGIAFGSVFWCTVPGIETIWWQHDKMTMTKWQYMLQMTKWQMPMTLHKQENNAQFAFAVKGNILSNQKLKAIINQ